MQNGKHTPLLTHYITEAAAFLYPRCEWAHNGEGETDVSYQQKKKMTQATIYCA